jgi:peptidoglycan/xylan/chitin deacetylase (PgdA/CDA1 family)
VLAYHVIEDAEIFASQMALVHARTSPLTLTRFVELLRLRSNPSAGFSVQVLLTFDDCDRSVVDIALPILRDLGLPAVAFPVTGMLDTDRPFWWSEVRELVSTTGSLSRIGPVSADEAMSHLKRIPDVDRLEAIRTLRLAAGRPGSSKPQLRSEELRHLESAGIDIGNHTASHPCLPTCSDDVVRKEVVGAHERLTAILGHSPASFCYPNGDWDPRADAILRSLGYEAAFGFDHRLCDPRNTDPLRVSRIRTNAGASIERFEMLLSGLHPALHHARGGI